MRNDPDQPLASGSPEIATAQSRQGQSPWLRTESEHFEIHYLRHIDDAEEISVRILQHDEISAGAIPPGIPARTQRQKPFHFCLLITRVEVEMQPVSSGTSPVSRLKR
jgi:hypothetical protein